ncbi:hypothetical protein GCM10009868_28610 [Terrabacter aerolatus]|uniref:Uncharacterized protein n=1 Tax=Terrabacter aerolatus TaxID=422442 RepID=A0A512CX97_9MICO|nr:hypothetical protein TAE01_06580 [Terrabacter aerolatus]
MGFGAVRVGAAEDGGAAVVGVLAGRPAGTLEWVLVGGLEGPVLALADGVVVEGASGVPLAGTWVTGPPAAGAPCWSGVHAVDATTSATAPASTRVRRTRAVARDGELAACIMTPCPKRDVPCVVALHRE